MNSHFETVQNMKCLHFSENKRAALKKTTSYWSVKRRLGGGEGGKRIIAFIEYILGEYKRNPWEKSIIICHTSTVHECSLSARHFIPLFLLADNESVRPGNQKYDRVQCIHWLVMPTPKWSFNIFNLTIAGWRVILISARHIVCKHQHGTIVPTDIRVR